MSRRILFYSHDTFGLGHIRRTQKIANAIASQDKSILVACSSPMANAFGSRPGIEYLHLPGFTKQLSGDYRPRSLHIPVEEFVAMRANLILTAVKEFRPELVVVDKEPGGVKGELLPALAQLKADGAKLICGFRDILDAPQKVQMEWEKKNSLQILREFYDSILIYGDQRTFDFCREYSLPDDLSARAKYTGYIEPNEPAGEQEFSLKFSGRPVVTFTLGGGGDGWPFITAFLDMIEQFGESLPADFVLLSGPFADGALKARAQEMERANFQFLPFTSDAIGLFSRSQLVICMGGYNTVSELLHLGKVPLILPRIEPRSEQLIRAKVFHQGGFCDFVHPSELSAGLLAGKIREHLEKKPVAPEFARGGLRRVAAIIEEMLECPGKSDSF